MSAAGPPQDAKAPSGGSAVRAATSVGATQLAAGPPQDAKTPSGGSAVRAATSVGATPHYIGRFAPSPTGALHAGSLVAALASWLDARAHHGTWLVRIEDVDTPRCVPAADHEILRQLALCGLVSDAAPVYQSQRGPQYQTALDALVHRNLAYPCACSRKDIEMARAASSRPTQTTQDGAVPQHLATKPRGGELVYPGTCRSGLHGKSGRAWRFNTRIDKANMVSTQQDIEVAATENIANSLVSWHDRRLGWQQQDVENEVGDFVVKRADGLWAYQLAVVVDDAAQGITHIVRGEDLADNTARQILLQRALGYPTPQYLHTPLVLAFDGHKLSKQNGAAPLDLSQPLLALNAAALCLGLAPATGNPRQALQAWTQAWLLQSRYDPAAQPAD
jgi:glutamyl-Q tRNA(Asp) synthetase